VTGGLHRALAGPFLAALALPSCSTMPRALTGGGEGAARIADLFWLFLAMSALVWILVAIALVSAARRRRASPRDAADLGPHPQDRRATVTTVAATILTIATLVVLTALTYFADRDLEAIGRDASIEIQVISHQWWWEIRYNDPVPSRQVTTANEIHVPVNEPVKLQLASTDVIHSFWVPELAGKKDLIPGQQTDLAILARRPGVYGGQCAEFCGYQHAHMGLKVIAESRTAFDAWREAQLRAAAEPKDDAARRGRDVFVSRACVMCHTVRGTAAGGKVAPDLTHVASRREIAAGTLPTTRGSLAAWIADPQAIKPGANMPSVPLSPDELDAVVAFVEGLK
jgi:cytochrome c oxidase subunit II